jgi:hypothetical protein
MFLPLGLHLIFAWALVAVVFVRVDVGGATGTAVAGRGRVAGGRVVVLLVILEVLVVVGHVAFAPRLGAVEGTGEGADDDEEDEEETGRDD